jgi:hypothetical protein
MAYTTSDVDKIKENFKLSTIPHYSVSLSTLGGAERATIIIKVSLDTKDTWENGIFHNSRYSMFSLHGGKMEQFSLQSQLPKFRKCNCSVDDVVNKIMKWSEKV